jgi:hypothetical protein
MGGGSRRASRRPAWRAVRLAAHASVVVALGVAAGCDANDGTGERAADTAAWCAQLDVAMTASVRLDALERGVPEVEEALAAVQDEMAALDALTPPAPIEGAWATLTDSPASDATGRVEAWAWQECALSPEVRAALDHRVDD